MKYLPEQYKYNQKARKLNKIRVFRNSIVKVRGEAVNYLQGVLKHPFQKHIHFSFWKYYPSLAGRRTGKTIAGSKEAEAELNIEGTITNLIAPTGKLTTKLFSRVWKDVVEDGVLGDPKKVIKYKRNSRDERLIEMVWGAKLFCYSGEAPLNALGDEADLFIADEAARLAANIFNEYIDPTLLDRDGRFLGLTTPKGNNWYTKLHQRRKIAAYKKQGWSGSRAPTWLNPFVNKKKFWNVYYSTPSHLRKELYDAIPGANSGLVYTDFKPVNIDEGGNLVTTEQLQEILQSCDPKFYFGGDIGTSIYHPTAAVWGPVDKHNNIYINGHYLKAHSLYKVHAQLIRERIQEELALGFISHDAIRKNPYRDSEDEIETAPNALDIFNQEGLPCILAPRSLWDGINVVSEYVRNAVTGAISNGLYIDEDKCPEVIEAFGDYTLHEPTDAYKVDPPNKPKSHRTDTMDSVRYLVAPRPSYKPNIRVMEQPPQTYEESIEETLDSFWDVQVLPTGR